MKCVKPTLLAVLLLAASLLTRLLFVQVFPTRPVSDFRGLVDFGLWMRDRSVTAGGYFWDLLNPGLPLVLSLIFRIFPQDPDTAARLSTAVATGLLPLFPFLLWRRVLPLRVRLLAGGMLALWPGQIFFSGVVAQDNWVLLPTVALACLAVRAVSDRSAHPVAAGLLYALGVAFRQEMLVALLPLLAAAALGSSWRARWRRSLLLCAVAAGVPLLLLALQRQAATGRFALSTEHGGVAVLGSYVPGSTANGWADPVPYIAAVAPSLLDDPGELKRQALRLAWREAAARPLFHTARILAFTLELAVAGDAADVIWSLTYPDVIPPPRHDLALAVARAAIPGLEIEMALLLALFLASLLLARPARLARSTNPAICILVAAMALKAGLHAVTVLQGRYFLPVTALEILVIALVFGEAVGRVPRRRMAAALAAGAAAATAVALVAPRAVARVRARDVDVPRVYRFSLEPSYGDPKLFDCVVRQGRLTVLSGTGARIETYHPDPSARETAAAECVSRAAAPLPPLVIRLLDPYAPGGSPGRMTQRVVVDGREGSGGSEIPLGQTAAGKRKTFRVELKAVDPQPGYPWGREAGTTFELARAQERR